EDLAKLVLGVERLAGDDRDIDLVPDVAGRVEVLGRGRLLEPERVVALDPVCHPDRVGRGEATVDLDEDVHARADRLADRGHALDRDVLDLPRDVRLPRPRKWIELHRVVALGDRVRGPAPPRGRVLQVARLAPGLAADPGAPPTGTA